MTYVDVVLVSDVVSVTMVAYVEGSDVVSGMLVADLLIKSVVFLDDGVRRRRIGVGRRIGDDGGVRRRLGRRIGDAGGVRRRVSLHLLIKSVVFLVDG
ncbi:hypothetical protein CDAR_82351, partial [Caerostris darwini]